MNKKLSGEIPVLSVRGPWLHLIAEGKKTIELRTRPLPETLRGRPVLLHLSKNTKWADQLPKMNAIKRRLLVVAGGPLVELTPGFISLAVDFVGCTRYDGEQAFLNDVKGHGCNLSAHPETGKLYGWQIERVYWVRSWIPYRGNCGVTYYQANESAPVELVGHCGPQLPSQKPSAKPPQASRGMSATLTLKARAWATSGTPERQPVRDARGRWSMDITPTAAQVPNNQNQRYTKGIPKKEVFV